MGVDTGIAWTDHTFNPWWGCARVSPGCENCYAETFSKRVGLQVWGVGAKRRFFGEKHWREPLKWNAAAAKAGVRRRVFCASMADVFEDRPNPRPGYHYDDVLRAERARLWALIHETPHLDWQLLTKRPENAERLAIQAWSDAFGFSTTDDAPTGDTCPWLPNIWLGTTVEDQKRADDRIPHLLATHARTKFLSCEPLLEDVRIFGSPDDTGPHAVGFDARAVEIRTDYGTGIEHDVELATRIDWVIVGGESGPGARPFAIDWARSIVRQCADAKVACFVKQMGAMPVDGAEPTGNFRTYRGKRQLELVAKRVQLVDRKGGNPDEWPPELRVQQFPEVRS